MSFLLSDPEFARARDGVRAGTVTDELYRWLGRLISATQVTRTLAPAAVPGGRWDDPDAVAETLQAWLEESLLRGGLLRAFDECQTPRILSRYLERSLRNWLVGRSRRRTGPRLLDRAAEIMDNEEEFVVLRPSGTVLDRWWGLSAWRAAHLFAGREVEVVAAAWALGDFAILRYSESERSDPVLSTPDLRRYLHGLLETLERGLNGRMLDTTFRSRFAYAYAPPGADPEEAETLAGPADVVGQLVVEEAARIALANLTERQLLVLMERPKGTLDALARRLDVSRGTVDNEQRRALMKVHEATPSDSLFDDVLETVLLLASDGENT